MKELNTNYGLLSGVEKEGYYDSNNIEYCRLNQENSIETKYGVFIPLYEYDSRRLKSHSIAFYKDGNIKSISLQFQTLLETSIGIIPAEKVFFYPDGNIKRIFPLDGEISGFWTEEDEKKLCVPVNLNILGRELTASIIGAYFYPNGAVKSITLWPGELLRVPTPVGTISCHIGISFYEDGCIKSCEPSYPMVLDTLIGPVIAHDNNPVGINGDINSLEFHENGLIKSMISDRNKIEIYENGVLINTIEPNLVTSAVNPMKKDLVPVKIEFKETKVHFVNEEITLQMSDKLQFRISHYIPKGTICTDCDNCNACG